MRFANKKTSSVQNILFMTHKFGHSCSLGLCYVVNFQYNFHKATWSCISPMERNALHRNLRNGVSSNGNNFNKWDKNDSQII